MSRSVQSERKAFEEEALQTGSYAGALSEEVALTRREIILSVSLVVVLMLLIGSWMIRVVPSPDVISYVSFAGTITSIILAAVAIVYSFYQTYVQQSRSREIAGRMGELKGSVTKIDTVSSKLDSTIQSIREMRSESERSRASLKQEIGEKMERVERAAMRPNAAKASEKEMKSEDTRGTRLESAQLEEYPHVVEDPDERLLWLWILWWGGVGGMSRASISKHTCLAA